MKRIWKFNIPIDDETLHLMLPKDAQVVSVGPGYDGSKNINPFGQMWIEGSFKHFKEREFLFRVFGTGHPIPVGWEHVGTFNQSLFVWHIYSYEKMV